MIDFKDLENVVDLTERGYRDNSVYVRLLSDMVVTPKERKYVTLHMQTTCKDPSVIFIGDSMDDTPEEKKWFLYTEIQPDDVNHKIVLLNLTDEVLLFKAGDKLGVIESYQNYNENGAQPFVPYDYDEMGDLVYSYEGLKIFDKDNTAKDITYTQTDEEKTITIKV